jgi:hypothetical protein
MIDYRTQLVALEYFQQALASFGDPDPDVVNLRDQHLQALDDHPEMAALGTLVHDVLRHASSDEAEVQLLETASSLWQQGLAIYRLLGELRDDLEGALADPSNPQSVDRFEKAWSTGHTLACAVYGKQAQIDALKQEIGKYRHLPPHPQQEDSDLPQWVWGDITMARRTDAFARSLYSFAKDGPTTALALGALSCYGASACGSAYLGQVVGGPRRSHRYRHRLAAYAVGSWFTQTHPQYGTFTRLIEQLKPGDSAVLTLSPDIEAALKGALASTYDKARTPALPDLQLGYRRLVRHLELLDTFLMPAKPRLPVQPYQARLFGNPSKPYEPFVPPTAALVHPQGGPIVGTGGGGVPPSGYPSGPNSNQTDVPASTGEVCGAFWLVLTLGILMLTFGKWHCWVVYWNDDKDCPLWEEWKKNWKTMWTGTKTPDPNETPPNNSGTTSQGLIACSKHEQVTELVGFLFELHNHMWEALNQARSYMAITGLIYPDHLLDQYPYHTLLRIPDGDDLPRRPEPDPAGHYQDYPSTPMESPQGDHAWYYPSRHAPDVFVTNSYGAQVTVAADPGMTIWAQLAHGEFDATNHNLDSDRGFLHPCWNAGNSIHDDPLNVVILAYNET